MNKIAPKNKRTAPSRRSRSRRLPGEPLPNRDTQRLLDVAMLRQAVIDLKMRIDGADMESKEGQECLELMLSTARWLFTNRHPEHVFNPGRLCQRLGVDVRKLGAQVFANLPADRQEAIREGLQHYRCAFLPGRVNMSQAVARV